VSGLQSRHLLLVLVVSLLGACSWGNEAAKTSASQPTGNSAPTVNKAPVISGTPPTAVQVQVAYSFTPTASDPDGDALTFTIANKPAWATFNTQTGALTGTPTAAQAGSFLNVTIGVTDGKASVNLPSFSLAVTAAPVVVNDKMATLSWAAPTQRIDGTPLVNLSGYKVFVGQSSGNYSRTIDVAGAPNTRYTVTGLSVGTWYFAISAYDGAGLESAKSPEVSKTF
jgi:hypothetical protein